MTPSGTTPAGTDQSGPGAALLAARRRKRLLVWGLLAVVLTTLAYFYVRNSRALPVVETLDLVPATAERILAVTGRVRPRESVAVVSRVPGQLAELARDEGDEIRVGEVLGRVDDVRARAALAQASAAIAAQRRVVEQAEIDLERARTLRKDGTVSAATLEATTLAVTRGREELRRLAAAGDEARADLDEYVIRAPLSGRVLSRPVDVRQVVTPATTIFEVAPMIDRDVETEVDEAYSMALVVGQPARMAFAGLPGTVAGTVSYLSPRVDTSTGGRLVRLTFTPPGPSSRAELPVGLSVDVNIVVERRDGALTVPRTVVREPSVAPHVFVVDDGRVARRDIAFRDWPSSSIIVERGLEAGDRVIISAAPPAVGTEVDVAGNGGGAGE